MLILRFDDRRSIDSRRLLFRTRASRYYQHCCSYRPSRITQRYHGRHRRWQLRGRNRVFSTPEFKCSTLFFFHIYVIYINTVKHHWILPSAISAPPIFGLKLRPREAPPRWTRNTPKLSETTKRISYNLATLRYPVIAAACRMSDWCFLRRAQAQHGYALRKRIRGACCRFYRSNGPKDERRRRSARLDARVSYANR
jgi:hypothetical protein